jgi:hypothetical protein
LRIKTDFGGLAATSFDINGLKPPPAGEYSWHKYEKHGRNEWCFFAMLL